MRPLAGIEGREGFDREPDGGGEPARREGRLAGKREGKGEGGRAGYATLLWFANLLSGLRS